MKSNFSKGLLMTALITGSVMWGGTNVFAEELQEYSLDQMVVTATRTEKRDVEVPATTNVITEQEIKNRGYVSVFDALEQTVGIQSYSYTGGEGDNGSSTGRTYIRGLDKGTLVLLNGAPINLNNYNSTAGIPISAVEKIEVVKGSNSVLYGSEAMGGVINIITKKAGKINNSIKAVAGNYKKGYEVASSGDKYILSFSRDYYKKFENSSINYKGFDTDRRAYTKNNLFASVNLAKDFTLNYMHTETKNTGMTYLNPDGSMNKTSYSYNDERDNVALLYNNEQDKLKSNLSFNRRRIDGKQYKTNGQVLRSGSSSNIILYTINYDINKDWTLSDKATLLTGVTANKEHYEEIANRSNAISRDSLAAYFSWNQKYDDKFSTNIGVRAHYVKNNGFDGAHNVYLPQLQTLYKLNENTSWYINVGKAFEMPAINSRYSRSKTGSNGALKPQEGWTYETGLKKITDTSSAKLAVFTMRMNDKFAWKKYNQLGITPPVGVDPDTYIQVNLGEFKNTGVEFEYDKVIGEHWRYNLGATYQDPLAKDAGKWTQQSSRYQFTAGAKYNYSKLGVGVNLYYLGDREDASYGSLHKLKNIIKLNSVINYDPDKNNSITLNLYNLLDRDNSINVSENLDKPFNWTLSYEYRF